jgi:hypothetical protein
MPSIRQGTGVMAPGLRLACKRDVRDVGAALARETQLDESVPELALESDQRLGHGAGSDPEYLRARP